MAHFPPLFFHRSVPTFGSGDHAQQFGGYSFHFESAANAKAFAAAPASFAPAWGGF